LKVRRFSHVHEIVGVGSLAFESDASLCELVSVGRETSRKMFVFLELVGLECCSTSFMNDFLSLFSEFTRSRVDRCRRECNGSKQKIEASKSDKPRWGRVVRVSEKGGPEGSGKWNGQSQRRTNRRVCRIGLSGEIGNATGTLCCVSRNREDDDSIF
jgi:hypothetical protein